MITIEGMVKSNYMHIMYFKNYWISSYILTGLIFLALNVSCHKESKSVNIPTDSSSAIHKRDLTGYEKIFGLSLLWKEVDYNFAFFSHVPELNLIQIYQDFIPKVTATNSTYEYYRELQKFCALLKDGHTLVAFPELISKSIDCPAIELKAVQKHAIIINISESMLKQIPIGSEILQVDGMYTDEYLKINVFPYISSSTEQYLWDQGISKLLDGIAGTKVKLTVKTPAGKHVNIELLRNSAIINEKWVRKPLKDKELLEFRWLTDSLAYLALNSFREGKILTDFWKIMDELYKCKGLIIDLRNNGGGNSPIGYEILKQLTSISMNDIQWYTRSNIAAYKAFGKWDNNYKDDYTGKAFIQGESGMIIPSHGRKIEAPLVVLIGPRTFSAAEDFLMVMETIKKDRGIAYVGEKTGGSTGSPLFVDLPGGGTAYICTIKSKYPDGRDFVGYGVSPDIVIENTVNDIQNNYDAVLNKALEILLKKNKQ